MPSSKNKIHKISSLISNSLEFPLEGFTGIPVIEIRGREEAQIYGCRAIKEYNQNFVIFDAKHYQIKVIGDRLILKDFLSGCVSITGTITDINIC